jgi:tRNA (cmo5U34)-methyltransferase
MTEHEWDPTAYATLVADGLPGYDDLQVQIVAATAPVAARTVLDLGTGTGETARRVLAAHPEARLVGVDASAPMLAAARAALDPERAELRAGRLEDPLPRGPFDLVVSALAVHHLDDAGKAGLFARAKAALAPGGRLVVGDVVIPEDPADAVIEIEPGFDLPSTVEDQLGWLAAAGLTASVPWRWRDLAVLVGERAA